MKIEDIRDPVQRAKFKAAWIRLPHGNLVQAVQGNTQPQAEARESSSLETKFIDLWTQCNGPTLKREAAVIPGRLFRIDFLHEESMTAIECQGFRDHTSRKGFARDNEKFLLLIELGYRVITLDHKLITEANVWRVIRILGRKPNEKS
jgi:hypothetical protein